MQPYQRNAHRHAMTGQTTKIVVCPAALVGSSDPWGPVVVGKVRTRVVEVSEGTVSPSLFPPGTPGTPGTPGSFGSFGPLK